MKVEILGTPFNGLGELPDIEVYDCQRIKEFGIKHSVKEGLK